MKTKFSTYLRDLKNIAQAQLASYFKNLYCPSLFGHFGVNSSCNLRCSYCYIHEPETYPKGFSEHGLSLEDAKKILTHLREECFALRLQGGEPLLYPHINELCRFAKEELFFRSLSLITNGIALIKNHQKYDALMTHMDVITLSIDGTRIKEYPREMEQLLEFLPKLNELAKKYRFSLTSNYTATWEELANPAEIEKNILRYQDHIPFFYVMPVRKVGKVPLELLKNSQKLMKKYSLGFYSGPEYPDVENVAWYQKHCNPKLKIKVMASGELLYPCENFSGTVGSLIHHSIREVWPKNMPFPNQQCLGCGKQRFRLKAFKRLDQQVLFALKKKLGLLKWDKAKVPVFTTEESRDSQAA